MPSSGANLCQGVNVNDEEFEAVDQAKMLIRNGYPVPTKDPHELAKILLKKRKNINSNRTEQESAGTLSAPKQ